MRTRLGSQQRLNKSNATTTSAHKGLVPFSGNDAPVLWPMSSGASSCFYSWCEEQRKRQQGLAYCSHETHQLRTWVDLGHLKMLSAQQCAEAERMAPGPTKVRFDRFPVFSTYVLLPLHRAEGRLRETKWRKSHRDELQAHPLLHSQSPREKVTRGKTESWWRVWTILQKRERRQTTRPRKPKTLKMPSLRVHFWKPCTSGAYTVWNSSFY